jgi:hypothetical protein
MGSGSSELGLVEGKRSNCRLQGEAQAKRHPMMIIQVGRSMLDDLWIANAISESPVCAIPLEIPRTRHN